MIISDVRRFGGCAALFVAAMLSSPAARSETNEARAMTLFEEGRKLARDHRCADALAPLLESVRYAEGVGPLLNLGHCYETLGKPASAQRYFKRAAEVAAVRGDTERRAEATQRVKGIEADVPMLVIRIPPAMHSPSVEVRLDGEVLPRDRWGMPNPVDPGAHEIDVLSPPHPKQSGSVTVRAKGEHVEWSATAPVAAPMALGPVVAKEPETREGGSTQRTLGLVSGGAGIGALVAGTIFGVLSISAHSSVTGRCPGYPTCSSTDRADLDEMNRRSEVTGDVSTISFIAAGALLVGGAVLFFTAPTRSAPTRSAR